MERGLTGREQDILRILVADYISRADPVGSRTIAKRYHGHLSPATVRNVMSDLTDLGFLTQPHTSAGRIPTCSGMRYYVDTLLKRRELSEEEMEGIRDKCRGNEEGVERVLKRTSKMLAAVSNYAGLVATPSAEKVGFKQIEFVMLSSRRLLGILVLQDGTVQNRLVDINEEISYRDLERITAYCNRCFSGLTIEDALTKVEQELLREREDYDRLLKKAMAFSKQMLGSVPKSDLVVEGEELLLDMPEFAESEKFRKLLETLEEKRKVLHILDRCREGEGVRIFIGAEASLDGVESIALVGAPYFKDGKVVGALGVIGPVRMDYSHVVPIVDFTAKVLGDALEI